MKIYFKEYGWVRAFSFKMWCRWRFWCSIVGHKWLDLGDPCRICGSDNCAICKGCLYHTHD